MITVVSIAIRLTLNAAGERELPIFFKHNKSRTYVLICINIGKKSQNIILHFYILTIISASCITLMRNTNLSLKLFQNKNKTIN